MSNSIAEVIAVTQERFLEIAPRGLNYASEKGFAIQQLKANNSLMAIAKKNPESLQQGITNVAAIGLSLSPAEHLSYLVPRGGKVCLDISYRGFCRMATNSGGVLWIQSQLVYANDKFMHLGIGNMPEHHFDTFASLVDRGDFKGVYVVAKLKGGDVLSTMMNAEEIFSVRDRSPSGKKGPWVSDFGEMAKKTCVRRAFKMWPTTDEHQLERMAIAVQLSNEAEGFAPLLSAPEVVSYSPPQKTFYDQLITAGDCLEIYVMSQTVESGAFNALYNSFEKGEITKYKRLVDDMMSKGKSLFEDYVNLYGEARDGCDEIAMKEIEEEISDNALELIKSRIK